ncbi:DUF1214 domain-containing protein [Carboxylicivirga sp. RSCT41]|uniref:DUF1214 domain-containing protein n=1 Tax=Carboxylicivirga agarovorans TaxID=3417570 RepID=UPI003D34D030
MKTVKNNTVEQLKRKLSCRNNLLTKLVVILLIVFANDMLAQDEKSVSNHRISEYIHWYPAIKQAEMRDKWEQNHTSGEWQITGLVSPEDRTVITPQADVNYSYSWFNISEEPVVITMPEYNRYYSLSIFDMHHFMNVIVSPEKPVVVKLPHQKNPIEDSYEIVLHTNQGLAFTRQVVIDNEDEVLKLAEQITIEGGGGNKPFIIPKFTDEEIAVGEKAIVDYSMKVSNGRNLFGSKYEGVGDLDRSAGVFLGQLGTQAYVVDYAQYIQDQFGEPLNGEDSYEIVVPAESFIRNEKGYWSLTIYNMEDRYLIPNDQNKYVISSYKAKMNQDGTITIRINPNGLGENALPSNGKNFYGVFRVYEPKGDLVFPKIHKVE